MDALAKLAGERIQHLAARSGNCHRRALPMQRLRDRPANAAGRAGHQRRPARQIEHQCLLREL
jgi:hypothetical protein